MVHQHSMFNEPWSFKLTAPVKRQQSEFALNLLVVIVGKVRKDVLARVSSASEAGRFVLLQGLLQKCTTYNIYSVTAVLHDNNAGLLMD